MNLNMMTHISSASFVPGVVPKVLRSYIPKGVANGIEVDFDRPMTMSSSPKDAISIIVNGGTPVKPIIIVRNPVDPSQVGFEVDKLFNFGDVVTWAYNDQHPTEEIKGAETGGKEIDNQTYGVDNRLDPTRAFSSAFNGGFE